MVIWPWPLFVLSVFAQDVPWRISASSSAVLAADSQFVYRGSPAGLSADNAGSSTSDIVVVSAVEKDGAWTWTVLPLSTGAVSFTAKYLAADGKAVVAPAVAFEVGEAELAKDADIADIKEPIKARPALWPFLLAAALAALGWYAWRRWKARRRGPDGAPTPSAPILPPAPAMFSTITDCPQALPSSMPMARAKISVLPPGVNGTMIRIVLLG